MIYRPLIALAIILAAAPALAEEYSSVKPLLLLAIDAPDGTAKGTLIGPIAERMHRTTHSLDPIEMEVTTLKEFKQEGCKRLNLRLIQPNALAKDGRRGDFKLDYGINFCRNGSAPTEGMDIGAFSRAVQQQRNSK